MTLMMMTMILILLGIKGRVLKNSTIDSFLSSLYLGVSFGDYRAMLVLCAEVEACDMKPPLNGDQIAHP